MAKDILEEFLTLRAYELLNHDNETVAFPPTTATLRHHQHPAEVVAPLKKVA